MKYLIVLTDGAGDEKMEILGNKTPLEVAEMPTINALAKMGKVGMVTTIPDGMSPGSDVANLSVMGYDPAVYHTGRSPLEAVSMGIEMESSDVAFRVNLITLEGDGLYEDKVIVDHSAGEISSEEAAVLVQYVNENLRRDGIEFYPGVSYRHAMIVKDGSTEYNLTPPHDILEQKTGTHLPKETEADWIVELMKKSYDLLKDHPVNLARMEKGLNPANSIWIWGQGKKPALTSFYKKYQVRGAVISAVDLIKGIGVCAGMEPIDVQGATGTIHTNFAGKADAAINAFKDGVDFIYLHLEAPDECSHQGDISGKIKSLELIDEKIVKPLFEYLHSAGTSYRIMVLPDHPTPLAIRTHTANAVPFIIYDSRTHFQANENSYSEVSGQKSELSFDNGYELTDYFFEEVTLK